MTRAHSPRRRRPAPATACDCAGACDADSRCPCPVEHPVRRVVNAVHGPEARSSAAGRWTSHADDFLCPRRMGRLNVIERRLERFTREPPSVRNAAGVIVVATVVVVVGAGVLIRVIDHEEYPSVGVGLWWALQTVTTVGYGDVAPKHVSGRLVGAAVMLEGIAFIAIITAVITSTFVARATREAEAARAEDELSDRAFMERRFDELERKIEALAPTRSHSPPQPPPPAG